jgi:hypothetical protein
MKYLIIPILIATTWLVGWNIGFDVGHKMGIDDAIIAGVVKVECKFPCPKCRTSNRSDHPTCSALGQELNSGQRSFSQSLELPTESEPN